MNSKFAQLFLKIQARSTANLGFIVYIDLDWGQLEVPAPPVLYPAMLVDMPKTTYTQFQTHQNADFTLQLRLATDNYQNSSNLSPDNIREAAMQFFEQEDQVARCFHLWDGDGLLQRPLIRTTVETELRERDNLRVRILSFEGMFID